MLSALVGAIAGGCVHSGRATRALPPEVLAARVEIPVGSEPGAPRMQAAVFWANRPTAPRPPSGRAVVVFNHGSPMTVAEREAMTAFGYLRAVHWFTARGYVVVAALRQGFGASGGRFAEGVAGQRPDYALAGRVAARDIHTVLDYVATIPGLDLGRVVLAGHSAGGFGSLAALGEPGVRVRAMINFAGGKGAQWLRAGALYTDGIVAAAAEYGRAAHTPALWIYADNDRWFAPDLVNRMFAAYTAGGAPAEITRLPAVGTDGHALFTPAAERLWSATAERFLARLGLPSAASASRS